MANETQRRTRLVVEERDKSGTKVLRRWHHDPNGDVVEAPDDRNRGRQSSIWRSLRNARQVLVDAFLPIGYPASVSPDYLAYQTYDSLQAFFSTITSLLANRAILQGLGVGDASSTATHALLLTILKDAISRVATISFAYRFGLAIEPDAKRYRFLADLFNDAAFFLDLASPYLGPWAKVATLTVGEALRALCGVAAGASKAALSSHFARGNNLAELNAKEASQETAIGLLGLLAGSIVVRLVEAREAVFTLMIVLVFVHLWMNYLGVCCVQLETLNRQRATIVFQHHLKTGTILSPALVAQMEDIVWWRPFITNRDGLPVIKAALVGSYDEIAGCQRLACRRGYQLFAPLSARGIIPLKIILTGVRDEGDHGLHDGEGLAALEAWYEVVGFAWNRVEGHNGEAEKAAVFSRELRQKMRAAGWRFDEHGFETGMPVRMWINEVEAEVEMDDKKTQ